MEALRDTYRSEPCLQSRQPERAAAFAPACRRVRDRQVVYSTPRRAPSSSFAAVSGAVLQSNRLDRAHVGRGGHVHLCRPSGCRLGSYELRCSRVVDDLQHTFACE
jgi:hypothetical protein